MSPQSEQNNLFSSGNNVIHLIFLKCGPLMLVTNSCSRKDVLIVMNIAPHIALISHCIAYPLHWLSIALIIHCIDYPLHWLSIALIIHCIAYPLHWLSIALLIHCIDYPLHWLWEFFCSKLGNNFLVSVAMRYRTIEWALENWMFCNYTLQITKLNNSSSWVH
jgi:hypothetical protein